MADLEPADQAPQLPEAPFPAPPPFWKSFTVANEEELKSLGSVDTGAGETEPTQESREKPSRPQEPKTLPLRLAYLRPPPQPPASAEFYTTFGQKQILNPTRPSALPRDQLVFDPDEPQLNHAVLLSKLTKSLLLNFLELTSILSLDPTQYEAKMDDIRQLVLNVHVVINMYRPHQARESVKEMLQGVLDEGKREMERCQQLQARVHDFLQELSHTPAADESAR